MTLSFQSFMDDRTFSDKFVDLFLISSRLFAPIPYAGIRIKELFFTAVTQIVLDEEGKNGRNQELLRIVTGKS